MASFVNMVGTLAMSSETRLLGTYVSDDLYDSGVAFADGFEVWVFVSAVSDYPSYATLDCGVETSTDGENWTFLNGSQITPLTQPSSTTSNIASDAPHVRVTSTVTGTDIGELLASVTYRVIVMAPAVAA
jgi:hypothetical protein